MIVYHHSFLKKIAFLIILHIFVINIYVICEENGNIYYFINLEEYESFKV